MEEEKTLDSSGKHQHTGQEANGGCEILVVREFEPADKLRVHQIFSDGMMEMIPDVAFRGLRHHPESLLLYSAMMVVCLVVTMCWWLIGLLPVALLCGRYFCSRRVILGVLERAMSSDMGHIEEFYMKSPDSRMWVAVLDGKVVGVVAAVGHQKSSGAVELQRMSVDRSCRRCGIGSALGCKVLEFAVAHGYSTVVLGTTAYTPAAHQLYKNLGFSCVGVTNGHLTPGVRLSLLERIFYRVRHHHYSLDVQNVRMSSNSGNCTDKKYI